VAKLKKTKTELKSQREALHRYLRFLPTLELKKQQIQAEVRHVEQQLHTAEEHRSAILAALRPWVKLLSGQRDLLVQAAHLVDLRTTSGNIAGVLVPVFEDVLFDERAVDYYATPPWYEDAMEAVRSLTRLEAERAVLARQRDLLAEELRITSQRVNLFEKVKIPQTRENIRVINIALGDAQTAAVTRAKIAKAKTEALVSGFLGR